MKELIPAGAPALCIDIGSCTQDALLLSPGESPVNATRFVLPSPALLLARDIAAMTEARRDIYLRGTNMGGGFRGALRNHVQQGLRAAMHPDAALALTDTPETLPPLGISLAGTCPPGYTSLRARDIDPAFWRKLCRMAGVRGGLHIVVAAQDHGFHPGKSNRAGRMELWRDFLRAGNGQGADPSRLIYRKVPPALTRLAAIQAATRGPVADTGSAALLGLLSMPEIAERSSRQGLVLVNAGNSHTVAFLVYQERVFGVYEQHTFGIAAAQIADDLAAFSLGWLPNEQVLAAGGHGCVVLDLPPEAEGFRPVYIAGPQRRLLAPYGQLAAPYDDVMLTGSFGLLHGLELLHAR